VRLGVAAAAGLAAGLLLLLLSTGADAARETTSFVFDVTAKATPRVQQISCPNGAYKVCLPSGTSYVWSGTATDVTAHLSGTLAGRCSASGLATGSQSQTPDSATATVSITEFEQASATAHCTFTLALPRGSLRGTAVVTSTLEYGDTPGSSSESVAISVRRGTGVYSGRAGSGGGKAETTVPPRTFTCSTISQGCGHPGWLVIPAVDTQSEAWHLTLR
jgi:hypothetical protein